MKSLLILLLATCVFSQFLPKPTLTFYLPTPQNLLDFLVGNLASLQVLETIPDAFPCVNALTSLKNNTDNAIALFKSGHFLTAIHLLENTFNTTIQSCASANSEAVGTFKNFLDILKDPNFVKLAVERIANNQLELIDDLAGGVEKLNNQSFFEAGVLFGKIPHTILSGPVNFTSINLLELSTNETSPLADFIRGYAEALQVFESIPDFQQCLNDLLGVKETLQQVISLLTQGKVLEAIELAQETLKTGVASCDASLTEGTQLFQQVIQKITAPGFYDLVKSRVSENFFTILEDAQKGMSDFKVLDFYQAGKDLGEIQHLVFSGPDA